MNIKDTLEFAFKVVFLALAVGGVSRYLLNSFFTLRIASYLTLAEMGKAFQLGDINGEKGRAQEDQEEH